MALKVVGSNPIIHPRKDTRLDTISSLVFLFYVGMIPEMGVVPTFSLYWILWRHDAAQESNLGREWKIAIVLGIRIVQIT